MDHDPLELRVPLLYAEGLTSSFFDNLDQILEILAPVKAIRHLQRLQNNSSDRTLSVTGIFGGWKVSIPDIVATVVRASDGNLVSVSLQCLG